ncbi:hypothetical protein HK096_010227, partial [Nowakowskiella sp. JEL0078]
MDKEPTQGSLRKKRSIVQIAKAAQESFSSIFLASESLETRMQRKHSLIRKKCSSTDSDNTFSTPTNRNIFTLPALVCKISKMSMNSNANKDDAYESTSPFSSSPTTTGSYLQEKYQDSRSKSLRVLPNNSNSSFLNSTDVVNSDTDAHSIYSDTYSATSEYHTTSLDPTDQLYKNPIVKATRTNSILTKIPKHNSSDTLSSAVTIVSSIEEKKPMGKLMRMASSSSIKFSEVEVGPSNFVRCKLIGKGDTGKVYLVRHKDDRKLYAMK